MNDINPPQRQNLELVGELRSRYVADRNAKEQYATDQAEAHIKIIQETEANTALIGGVVNDLPRFRTTSHQDRYPKNYFSLGATSFDGMRRIQQHAAWLGGYIPDAYKPYDRNRQVADVPFYVIGEAPNAFLLTPAKSYDYRYSEPYRVYGAFALALNSRKRKILLPTVIQVNFEPKEKKKIDMIRSKESFDALSAEEVSEAYFPNIDKLIVASRSIGSFLITRNLRDYRKPIEMQALCTSISAPSTLTDDEMRSMRVAEHIDRLTTVFNTRQV